MAKELLIYGSVDAFSSSEFIKTFGEVEAADDLVVRVNTNGGSPEYGWGMVAKFAEHKGSKTVKIDGKAYSMGMFIACYADDVEALDVSEFLLHRAAYPQWFENDPEYFTETLRSNLERINKSLRAAFESKVDVAAFESLKGVKLKDVFAMDSRLDVFFTAQEAKKIGLVKTINQITPKKRAEIDSRMEAAARHMGISIAAVVPAHSNPQSIPSPNTNKMTIEQLKAEHPALYAAAVQDGVAQERDRVEACLVFLDIDPKGVKAAIENGKPLTAKQMAEFTLKAANPKALAALEKESAPATETAEAPAKPQTEAEKTVEAFEATVRKNLGLTTKS